MELLVYKASAGSGKTFTLAVEYIKHLIINPMRLPADTCRNLHQQGYGRDEGAHTDTALRYLEGENLLPKHTWRELKL